MKNWIILLIIVSIGISGCVSHSEQSEVTSTIPTITPNLRCHDVFFQIVDQNNTPIEGAYITANYDENLYNEITTRNCLNNLKGYTDSNGNWDFWMNGSIEYNITILSKSLVLVNEIHPTNSEYQIIMIPTPTLTPTPIPTKTKSGQEYGRTWVNDLVDWACPLQNMVKC